MADETKIIIGDINGDEIVDSNDATSCLAAATAITAHTDPELTIHQFMCADVNCDGEITQDDAQDILNFYTQGMLTLKDIGWDDILVSQTLPVVFSGYYVQAQDEFYYDSEHTQIIQKQTGCYYYDITPDVADHWYQFSGASYVVVSSPL